MIQPPLLYILIKQIWKLSVAGQDASPLCGIGDIYLTNSGSLGPFLKMLHYYIYPEEYSLPRKEFWFFISNKPTHIESLALFSQVPFF